MPTNEVEHNYDSLNHHLHSFHQSGPNSQFPSVNHLEAGSSDREFDNNNESSHSSSPLSSRLPLLPATTYKAPGPPTSPRQLSLTTNFTDLNFRRHHPTSDEASPDPREFYLQYNDPFGGDGHTDFGGNMTSASYARKTNISASDYHNYSPTSHRPPFSSRSRPYRASSSNLPQAALFSASRPSSINPSVQRNPQQRQSSLKELVDKFNQNFDQVPPRPPHSLASSRDGSPGRRGSTHSRASSTQQQFQRGTRDQGDFRSPPRSERPGRHSQSSINVNNSTSNSFGPPLARRPLFGEIIPSHPRPVVHDRDIASPRWRRGSDGSMHMPNPMFVDLPVAPDSAFSPTSPTAWYLGYSSSFDTLNTTAKPPVTHRRSRSDLVTKPSTTTTSSSSTAASDISDPSMGISINQGGLQPAVAIKMRPKSNSQSRIPVSTRRLSQASDSGGSTPSTRTNSAMDRHNVQITLPPKGLSALPKRSPRNSPSSKAPPTTLEVTSAARHNRGQTSHLTPDKSPRLNAYISAPPPKKSPPLRSSRPRQPVSSATTSASRARVVDRISSLQNQSNASTRDSKPSRTKSRRLPELGNVDFAARRQKIQQAFNKTVEENAKREERAILRRQSAREKASSDVGKTITPTTTAPIEESRKEPQPTEISDQLPITIESRPGTPSIGDEQDIFVTPDEGRSPKLVNAIAEHLEAGRRVTFDANNNICSATDLVEKSISQLDIPRCQTPCSDIAPPSAVTVGTDITTFDQEPQTDFPQPSSQQHRTVLSQIMQMRESSPSSSASSDSYSGRDDKESIKIMLRRSHYFDESQYNSSDNLEPCDIPCDFRIDVDRHRWSMSSWSSSIQDRQSIDGPLGRITENSPETDVHISIPTGGNNRTPQPPESQARADSPTTGEIAMQRDTHDLPSEPTAHNVRYTTHMMQQYPDLAKQGGWNSKRVTQLFLQELGFEGSHLLKSDFGVAARVQTSRPSSRGDDTHKNDALSEDPIIIPESINVPRSEYVQHRASLNFREDWEKASASVVDWMHVAAAEEGPANSPNAVREKVETPRLATIEPEFSAEKEAVEGLGLAIHVQSPQDDDPPTIPPPPLPNHSPPPIPIRSSSIPEQFLEPLLQPPVQSSPSIYSNNPPSTIPSSIPRIPSIELIPSVRSREESSLQQAGLVPSPQTLASSTTSQEQSSAEQPSVEAPAVKSSPSPEQRRLKKRKHVIKELVDTEHTFGQDMTVVVDIYKGTSSSCLDLSQDDIKTLFGNSDQVVQFSMDFQDSLKRASKSVYVLPQSQRWKSKRGNRSTQMNGSTVDSQTNPSSEASDDEKDRQTSIGQVFVEHIERMEKVYSEYLRNHDAANRTLEMLMRKNNVNIWLKECRDWAVDLTSAWNLDSLLVKPVQRIVKYPLLLTELLSATPPDHPDHAALTNALRETTSISVRINDMKKRADVVGQIVSGRKRKESDVRTGLSKAFGRRTEKIKAHVGITDVYADKEFTILNSRFGDNFFQLQLIMRDVELYTTEVQTSIKKFHDYVLAIEAYINVAPSNYPELESKWCRFRLAVKDVLTVALVDHVSAVRKSVIVPMVTLISLHDGPRRVMQKRNKRLMDYIRYKTLKDRGDKADKKTTEQGEQFVALDVTLKEELPKLFALTGKLTDACLHNFVELQKTWLNLIQKRLGYIFERTTFHDLEQIKSDWAADFSFSDAQVLSLGICNGSILADIAQVAGFNSPSASASNAADGSSSSRRPSTVNSMNIQNAITNRAASLEQSNSPKLSHDFGISTPGSFMQSSPGDNFTQQHNGSQVFSSGRVRTNSGFSGRASGVPDVSNGPAVPSMTALKNPGSGANSGRPSDGTPSLPRLSLDTPMLQDILADPLMALHNRGTPPDPALHPSSPTVARTGSFFSSAMPMNESPQTATPVPDEEKQKDPAVLFPVASLFEFNIDRARREAGYPYLTYVAGEIFDVIGEKGDLWLARNQDDPTRQVGWIWTKHFSKLAG
ncbi:rho guanyl nucleotide exchange factor [Blastomyces dermatitidis ER-3]|uniref:Rho guanyl nucleotide exchange factor n=2 Tax=Ajellomyces dermatitidis TaxID=5039 RepID=F2TQ88_AJEDA|nr:rho guanyl nucleotide exchange factor [Blastomyces dermatitidis ER-3]EEQ91919.1 rho guanyl nucleotide exchange factor [Blastomyces dermatitidis ER-3]EGE85401.1 rho guanyl nucleotide exchange factor [Blastomyces dermatitidis ATCC 18188]